MNKYCNIGAVETIKVCLRVYPGCDKNAAILKKRIVEHVKRYLREKEGLEDYDTLIAEDISELLRVRSENQDLAKSCTIFIKALATELNGKAVCTADQLEQWRNRYGVRLENLKSK